MKKTINKKVVFLFSILLFIFFALITYTYISNKAYRNEELSINNKKNIYDSKTQKVLNTAWKDIVNSYKINESSYYKLQLYEIPLLYKGEFNNFNNMDYCQAAARVIDQFISEAKSSGSGFTMPVTMISRDKKEVLVFYKDSKGNNIMNKAIFYNDKLISTNKQMKKGTPILYVP
jgi:hypothetical protein